MDANDESLVKYNEMLLGKGDSSLDEGGNNVLVKALVIHFDDRDPVRLDLSEDLEALKNKPIVIRQGAPYKLEIEFRVQREIVTGLRFYSVTSRKGISVDKMSYMIGSYGPKQEVYSFMGQSEEAPKGMMALGHYDVKSKVVDDDQKVYLEWDWGYDIKRDW